MSGPSTFLSFPDFSKATSSKELAVGAGPSRAPASSFSSFPDIEFDKPAAGKRDDKTHDRKYRSAEKDDRGEGLSKRRRREEDESDRRKHRRDREERNSKSSRREHDAHESSRSSRRHREGDSSPSKKEEVDRRRDTSGRRRQEEDKGKERMRDRSREREREKRSRDRDHDRDRDRERGRDRERLDKRSRRGKDDERDRDERRLEKEQRRAREREQAEALRGDAQDDGRAWYETTAAAAKATIPTTSFDWFEDVVGDEDILRYREVATRNPLRYYRDFGGRVFGLPGNVRAVRSRVHAALEVSPFRGPYIPRYSARAIDGSLHQARLLMRPKVSEDDLDADFLPLESRHRRALGQDENDLPDYRAITKDAGEEDDPEYDDMVAVLGDLSTVEDDLKAQQAEFERELRARPENIERWIKYSTLHLQLSSDAQRVGDGSDPSKAPQTRANAEVTLSVLQRAFDAHRDNFTSTDLHIAFLRAAESLWPPTKVTERWKNVILELGRTVPEEEMMKVYLAYIDWREGQGIGGTGSTTGGVDEVVAVYIECIERLSGIDRDNEAREENQVYLLLRACLFMKSAGFTERALATLQAAMEITFFKPAYLRPPASPFDRQRWFSGVLMEFEDFWDSEAPRIGEEGAKGWSSTHESETLVEAPLSRPKDIDTDTSGDPYARWYRAERRAEQSLALPGRARDLDPPGDDPFHMIMFEDVAPFLLPIQTPLARLQLIYAFLTFLGLPFAPPEAPTSAPSASDPHLRWSLTQNEAMRAAFWPPRPTSKRIVWQTVGGAPMDAEQPRTLQSPFGCPVKSWMSNRSTQFANDRWFRDINAVDVGHVDAEFARNVLTIMRPLVPDPSFVLSTFVFEAALSHKGAVKAAKSILASDSDNLVLWDGYARLERQRGKLAAARQVYVTAIQASEHRAGTPGVNKNDLELDMGDLWAAWAELEWDAGEEDRCLQVLGMAAGVQRERIAEHATPGYTAFRPPPIAMLKLKQHYTTTNSEAPHHLVLGALFFALTDGIEATRDRMLGIVDALPEGSPQIEETLQLLVKTIFVHNSRNASPASLIRDVLERAIRLCPNNTIFLSLYQWGESSRRVYGNVQRLSSRLITEDHGIVPLLWAVWAESQGASRTFYDAGGSGAERARRALDRSINLTSGRQSAGLWMLYIEFEVLMGRPEAAKALCYRAMAAVGGCKDLYLLPFSTLRLQFTSRELREVAELMIERGIRMRVDTQDFWDDQDSESEKGESEDEMIGPIPSDYEYGMLREREVLKPY